MTYDSQRKDVVIFGGETANETLSNDTWSWNAKEWRCVAGAGARGPSARSAAMLAYDADRRVLVLYGGRIGRQSLRDTWELSDAGWQRVDSLGPTPEPHGVMAFDASSHGVLLFHSLGDDGPTRLTWRWNGRQWAKVAEGPHQQFPNALFASNGIEPALLVTARATGVSDVFDAPLYSWGGIANTNVWRAISTTGNAPAFSPQAPAARTSKGALLYAGFESSGKVTTWVLEGTVWRKHAGESPPRRRGAQMVFDSARNVVVLHAGDDGTHVLSDTWEWNGSAWSRVK